MYNLKFFVVLLTALIMLLSPLASADIYEDQDEYESINRAIFGFNYRADRYVLKPVAKAYKYVTPRLVNEGITNFFNNLGDVKTIANSLLQAKFHNAMVSLNRVIYNTTFGLGGLIDVATFFGLENDNEDFGQTLAFWGYENSTYLMIPFLGPSTTRDFMGRILDRTYEPLQYFDELHEDGRFVLLAVDIIDQRADLLGAENLLSGVDKYRLVRSAYFQNREYLIKDGDIEDPFADEDLDEFEDF